MEGSTAELTLWTAALGPSSGQLMIEAHNWAVLEGQPMAGWRVTEGGWRIDRRQRFPMERKRQSCPLKKASANHPFVVAKSGVRGNPEWPLCPHWSNNWRLAVREPAHDGMTGGRRGAWGMA